MQFRRRFISLGVLVLVASYGWTDTPPPDLQPVLSDTNPPTTSAPQAPATSSGVGIGGQGGGGSSSLGLGGWISRGRSRLSIGAGWGSASNGSYAILAAGYGYYLLKGLELGLDGEAWLGNDPHIYKLTPGLRYVFALSDRLFPYVGTFYRRVFYSDESPLDSFGGRVGAYVPIGSHLYAGGGLVVEHLTDCNSDKYDYCTTTYPEVNITFSF